ncbi:MAG: iron-containing alcohol dehydrogenase [Victivallis sp.]
MRSSRIRRTAWGWRCLLPAVVKNIYPQESFILADLLKPIAPDLEGEPEEAHEAGKAVQAWLNKCGVTQKLCDVGFRREDIDKLVDMTIKEPSLAGLLEQAPGYANATSVAAIYMNSFMPLWFNCPASRGLPGGDAPSPLRLPRHMERTGGGGTRAACGSLPHGGRETGKQRLNAEKFSPP